MSRRAAGLAVFLALAVGVALAGFWLLFTSFKTYDDEGYVLISLANYARGGRLYGEIFSQYGPFFYVWSDALHRLLGFDFTSTTARLLTLFYWLGAALLCAGIVAARTRSAGWAALALAATFAHLWQMTAEPGHPGGLIAFLVALGACGGAECIVRDRKRTLAILVGAIGAALALTKINVGVFFFAGAGAWLALNSSTRSAPRAGPWLAGGALVALPWVLMHSLLPQLWAVKFAVIASGAALGTMIAARPSRRSWFSNGGWRWLVGAALALAASIAAVTLARGTSLGELLDGIVLAPLRHPGIYFFPVEWRPGALALALVSLAVGVTACARGWNERPAFVRTVALVRLLLLVTTILGSLSWLPVSALALTMSYGLSLVWLLVIPLGRDAAAGDEARVRGWLGLLLVTQALHAYPVGGSQIGWGTFLWAPLLVLACAEAVRELGSRPVLRWVQPLAAAAACAIAAAFAREGWQRWHTSAPLRLPGAMSLRLPELLSARLRAVTLNASVHAGELFSLPGQFSFNLWSGRPTPTLANTTHWFSLLNPARQQAIATNLAADPNAIVVVERDVLRFLRVGGIPVEGVLHDYLKRDFAPAFATGNYEVWCKRGRTIAPLATAHLYRRGDGAEKNVLEICVFTPPGARIARVEWVDCSDDERTTLRLTLDARNSRLEIVPLFPNGLPRTAPVPAPFPAAPPPFAKLEVNSNEALAALPRHYGLLRLRAPDGALVAEAVFAD